MTVQTLNPDHILVFKTSIKTRDDLYNLQEALTGNPDITEWSIDLEDCDKVLRVVSEKLSPVQIIDIVNQHGYLCIELI
ncbi:hypothetical protein DJ568_06790 [Mucilaginibacter hurinus]|uniref:Uncharacterized protein n=1 Tax=Mucilaginibacter hurinus TaxID=2201324 RepID=A0A367GSA1_9SPHI|nr:hypothetical protein [Mucilaginibacter hurinus]RCH55593.1 hypothetical protein DJ568_06790 [Mucilaginibacter hurinus]